MAATIRVRGLAEYNRALKNINSDLHAEIRDTLRDLAEPVARTAEQFTQTRIPTVTERWAKYRIGVTNRVVYVAPKARRRGGSERPNFGTRLMEDAMIPALEANAQRIEHGLELMIDKLGARNGF